MPIIPSVGRRSWYLRAIIILMYMALTLLGITMVVPFMITVASSISNDFDYERFRPIPRYLTSPADRFLKGLVSYYNTYPEWYAQMRASFRTMPPEWTSWQVIGKDLKNVDKLTSVYLHPSSAALITWKKIARDYSEFEDSYPLSDTVCPVSDVQATYYFADRYERIYLRQHPEDKTLSAKERREKALEVLSKTWDLPLPDFYTISFEKSEARLPIWQQSWLPPGNPKYQDFLRLKEAYKNQSFTPGLRRKWLHHLRTNGWDGEHSGAAFPVDHSAPEKLQREWARFRGEVAPASPAVPFAMRAVWRSFLESEEVRDLVSLDAGRSFDVAVYNQLAGARYTSLQDTPFPVPTTSEQGIQALWEKFVETRYPVRLISLHVTPQLAGRFHAFLKGRFKTLDYANRMLLDSLSPPSARFDRWDQFLLTPEPPEGEANNSLRSVWVDFVKELPVSDRILTSSEIEYQKFLLRKYGDMARINVEYGWQLQDIEEAFPPVDIAYALTFRNNQKAFVLAPLAENYTIIADYLLHRGRAVTVTLVLVGLAILSTLTINPMAAYALSRFNLRGQDKVVLFMLATMAFPAMVSAIPAYLLMRDLGLLNTFLALILPAAANGMGIFLLKGFFDSLPQELYEAATIDGAPEWQIFLRVTLPMMAPILAIQSLNAFIWAYNSWEWALIICQNQKMWTMAVWMYQANQWWYDKPWIVAAGFVVISIPTLLVFLFCQRIILRGIIIPQMK
ncbi:MAG: hypothetical protein AUJ92_12440 [Armatimonadetes bacterium CG2_30_59_28]|nr:MAG: hypothetical protein AUJ92_12440 [Armatimonadetes bacterium CG2_30_59_28]